MTPDSVFFFDVELYNEIEIVSILTLEMQY